MQTSNDVLKYYFRYAVISIAKYTNLRIKLCRLAGLVYWITEPMANRMHQPKGAVEFFDSMLGAVCKMTKAQDWKVCDAGQLFFDDITIKRLVDALNILPAFKRQLIVLHDIELMSNKQIADIYSCPTGKICQLVPRIQKELASLYAQLWPFAREDDIKGMCENLLRIREYVDERFVAEAIMEMEEE